MFTSNGCTIYFDGTVANKWYIETPGDGSWIDGLLNNYGDSDWLIKYICLGGNQARNWGDNDAPFKFANLRIQNNAMTAEQITAQMDADKANATAVQSVTAEENNSRKVCKMLTNGKFVIETNTGAYNAAGAQMK